jgi:3-dehydroquinate dehydratase type I
MARPRICAAITNSDIEAVNKVAPLVDLFEVRIDLIGEGWEELAGKLEKPWIACNRRKDEGGSWNGSETDRINEILKAISLEAAMVDIELSTPGVHGLVAQIKGKAEILLSYHNTQETPSLDELKEIVQRQLDAGADICKVVTTAGGSSDNVAVTELIKAFPDSRVVSFAMGPDGQLSRILCPLVGGYFTYASITPGKESAAGQLTVAELREIYRVLGEVDNA